MRPLAALQNASPVLAGICLLVSACGTQPLPGALTQPEYLQQGIEVRTHSKGTAPQLGLALAGGGTKAADFSIGVLQGLTEAGVMQQIDAVSTVSGGGYAALWYFARLLNPDDNPDWNTSQVMGENFMKKFFLDCLPSRYMDYWNSAADGQPEQCPKDSFTNYTIDQKNQGAVYRTDPVRYQNYLRGYQDLFQPVFDYKTTEDDHWAVKGDLLKLTLRSLLTLPISLLSNAVFDWDLPISTSQDQYETGIVRTFGAIPPDCSAHPSPCPNDKLLRPIGNAEWVQSGLTFKLLREEYERGRIPLWIINSTAGEDRAHPASPQKDFHLTSFEFSPYGSGSGLFNYSRDQLGSLRPWEAVVSSAAFIDSQQKVLEPRILLNPLIRVLTLDWSRTIPNPYMPQWQRLLHYILPIPFYSLYGRDGSSPGAFVNIRLSDGGQSENLGAFALVQRNLTDLVISDHGQDQQGTMEDVCRLKQLLAHPTNDEGYRERNGPPRRLFVYFPGLSQLDHVCDREARITMSYDIFQWDHPIVLGCMTSDVDDRACSGKPRSGSHSFRRIYLIKPALPSPQSELHFGKNLGHAATACADEAPCKEFFKTEPDLCMQMQAGTPYPHVSTQNHMWYFEKKPACELLTFLMMNSFKAGQPKQGGFPQLSTVGITANSSPWVYGAYRELGRYYARQLGWFWGFTSENTAANEALRQARFSETIERQRQYPLLPLQKDSWRVVQERLQQKRP